MTKNQSPIYRRNKNKIPLAAPAFELATLQRITQEAKFMQRIRLHVVKLVVAVFVFTVGCSVPLTPTTTPTAVPTSIPPTIAPTAIPTVAPTKAPTVAPTTAPTIMPTTGAVSPTSTGQFRTPLDALPPGPGRALLIPSCDTCHSYLCGVFHKLTVDHWRTVRANHGTRIGSLNAADFNTVFEYLMTNFNATKPEPDVPPEIKQGATCIERG